MRDSDQATATESHSRTAEWWVPLGAAFAVLVTSIPTLGRKDLWLDEAFTVGATNQLLDSLYQRSGSMGLYYVLIAPWKDVSLDPAWLRFPSTLFAAAGVGLAVHLARRLFGLRVAVWSAILMVPLWGVTRFAQETRSYALVMLLTVVSWVIVIRLVDRRDDRRLWVLWGLCSAAAIYSHPLAGLAAVAQLLALRMSDPDLRTTVRSGAPGLIALGVLLVPMAATFTQEEGAAPDWVPPLGRWSISDGLEMLAGPSGIAQLLVFTGLAASSIVVWRQAEEAHTTQWARRAMVAWLWVPAVALVLISVGEPMFVGRYLIGSLPAASIVAALAITRVEPRVPRLILGAAVVALLVPGQISLHTDHGPPWREAASLIEDQLDSSERHGILFLADASRPPFEVNNYDSVTIDSLSPVYPVEELGSNLRYFDEVSGDELRTRFDGLDVIWLVEQRIILGRDTEEPPHWTMEEPLGGLGFCRTESTELRDSIEVTRFDPCG
ncbi:MAG: glycosyltransferase family 39 protein [Acidimicrobiales bacterium]